MISGATKSGKTQWGFQLLKHVNTMFDCPPDKILYCYGIYQPLFDRMKGDVPGIQFHQGLPSQSFFRQFANSQHNLIILDDLMSEVSASREAELLFTRGCHHMNLSVCYLVQNLFQQNKHSRTISLNCQYLVLFRNLRDGSQIMFLARQLYPITPQILLDAYFDATSIPFGYLLINLHPRFSVDAERLQTHIFPDESRVHYEPLNLQ